MDRRKRDSARAGFSEFDRKWPDAPPRDILRLVAKPLPDDFVLPAKTARARPHDRRSGKEGVPDHLMTANELAEYLQVPVSWCWRAARLGMLPHYRCGQYIRYDLEEVLRSLKQQEEGHDESSGK